MSDDHPIRVAYADPPYLGQGRRHYGKHHPEAHRFDRLSSHHAIIEQLVEDYPDGWALSLSAPSLRKILPLCPEDCRVGAWVKPFASFKPGVNPGYCWEPVVWRGGRKRGRDLPTVREYVSANITLKRGLTGAKPETFSRWLFDLLGLRAGDELVDLFPGSEAVSCAWESFANTARWDSPTGP